LSAFSPGCSLTTTAVRNLCVEMRETADEHLEGIRTWKWADRKGNCGHHQFPWWTASSDNAPGFKERLAACLKIGGTGGWLPVSLRQSRRGGDQTPRVHEALDVGVVGIRHGPTEPERSGGEPTTPPPSPPPPAQPGPPPPAPPR